MSKLARKQEAQGFLATMPLRRHGQNVMKVLGEGPIWEMGPRDKGKITITRMTPMQEGVRTFLDKGDLDLKDALGGALP